MARGGRHDHPGPSHAEHELVIRLALATGWNPSEVAALTLGHLEVIGEVRREQERAAARARMRRR